MSDIKLVIFDCDGVLMDSEIVAAAAELEVYSEYGVEMTAKEFAERFAGLDAAKVKARMEDELGRELPDTVVPDTRKLVNEKTGKEAAMIPDADTILDRLDQARCVCSNSPVIRLEQMLTRVGLYDRFKPYIFSAQAIQPPIFKPKPDLFLNAMEEFEASPTETLVVEDSVHGIHGAVAAGCRIVGFTGASHTYPTHADDLIEAGAETVINRMSELPSVVEAFSGWGGIH
jgi:HAD superfamily hydrolase (TIGR01509 family)